MTSLSRLFKSKEDKVRFSKKLSSALRHQAAQMGLSMQPNGFVLATELLQHPNFRGHYQLHHLEEVVATCEKQRFELKRSDDGRQVFIRARQGHSMAFVQDDDLLERIIDATAIPYCYHGTYADALDSIKQSGLSRMRRKHIHLIPCAPRSGEVISGMRNSANVVITIDVARALAAGIPFYRSSNDVILSPGLGDTGCIPPEFFCDISDRRGKRIDQPQKRKVFSEGESSSSNQQIRKLSEESYTHYCVIDFEATCIEKGIPDPQEVIEFPAVMLCAASLQVVDEFQSFVRPVHHPQLSAFCHQLTAITQEQVDAAPVFTEVLQSFFNFIDKFSSNYSEQNEGRKTVVLFVTCGDWDFKSMLPSQCATSQLAVPACLREWMNVKTLFNEVASAASTCRRNRARGMEGMLAQLGLPLLGHHHSGIDDSRNIASMLRELVKRGGKPRVTATT